MSKTDDVPKLSRDVPLIETVNGAGGAILANLTGKIQRCDKALSESRLAIAVGVRIGSHQVRDLESGAALFQTLAATLEV